MATANKKCSSKFWGFVENQVHGANFSITFSGDKEAWRPGQRIPFWLVPYKIMPLNLQTWGRRETNDLPSSSLDYEHIVPLMNATAHFICHLWHLCTQLQWRLGKQLLEWGRNGHLLEGSLWQTVQQQEQLQTGTRKRQDFEVDEMKLMRRVLQSCQNLWTFSVVEKKKDQLRAQNNKETNFLTAIYMTSDLLNVS